MAGDPEALMDAFLRKLGVVSGDDEEERSRGIMEEHRGKRNYPRPMIWSHSCITRGC